MIVKFRCMYRNPLELCLIPRAAIKLDAWLRVYEWWQVEPRREVSLKDLTEG